jgi:inhibitor of KinA sporulation pathway (predicted exonuclease)
MHKFDKIVIVDVESTCWEGGTPAGQISEIIEIGICTLDLHSGAIEQNEGILIKPQDSTVSDFCTQLTTITPDMVENGISFAEACTKLETEYLSKNRVWASYGAYDHTMFVNQCSRLKIPYPFSNKHINVKTLFSLKSRMSKEVGMSGALRQLGFELEGTHHRGVDDARNIAKILNWVLG